MAQGHSLFQHPQYLFIIRIVTSHPFFMCGHVCWNECDRTPSESGKTLSASDERGFPFVYMSVSQWRTEGTQCSAAAVCVYVCVCGGGGSLDWKRQQGCTVRTTKPQRHCYCANGEPAIYADIFVRLSHRAKVKHFIVGKTARLTKHWLSILFLFDLHHLPELTFYKCANQTEVERFQWRPSPLETITVKPEHWTPLFPNICCL